jgi:opacity protein-like surface antigen
MKRWVIAGAAACLAAAAQAQTVEPSRTYVELGYSAVSYEENALGYHVKSTPKALRGVVGYEPNDNVALEFMAAGGLGYSDVDVTDQSVPGLKLKINSLYGLYVTPKTRLVDNLEGFVRLGYVHARGTAALGVNSSADTDNGFSYGVGMRYHFDRTTFLNVDYMSYLHNSDYKAKGVTVGMGFKF